MIAVHEKLMPFGPGPMGGGARRRTRRRMVVVSSAMLSRRQKQPIQQHTGKDPDKMLKAELQKAADELQLEPEQGQGEPQATSGGAPQQDYTAELERLADLHNRGVLTDDEIEAKKKQILGL